MCVWKWVKPSEYGRGVYNEPFREAAYVFALGIAEYSEKIEPARYKFMYIIRYVLLFCLNTASVVI